MKVFQDRVYVASSEKQISVYDLVTFAAIYPDKKIEAAEVVMDIAFYGEKVFVGEKNKTLEIFNMSGLALIKKLDTRGDVTQFLDITNSCIAVAQDDGFLDLLSPYND